MKFSKKWETVLGPFMHFPFSSLFLLELSLQMVPDRVVTPYVIVNSSHGNNGVPGLEQGIQTAR